MQLDNLTIALPPVAGAFLRNHLTCGLVLSCGIDTDSLGVLGGDSAPFARPGAGFLC